MCNCNTKGSDKLSAQRVLGQRQTTGEYSPQSRLERCAWDVSKGRSGAYGGGRLRTSFCQTKMCMGFIFFSLKIRF